MFKKLLVPLDGSALAEQAVGQAEAIARAANADIDLVLVHRPIPFDGLSEGPWSAEEWDDEHRYLEEISTEVTSGAGIAVSHAVMRGDVTEMICRRIWDVGADMVVLTSHGRGGLSKVWFGSVAESLIRHSSVPVLMLRPKEKANLRSAAQHTFRKILVPLDGSTLASDILVPASELAKATGARVTLLRVIEPVPLINEDVGLPFAFPPLLTDDPATERVANEARQELRAIAKALRADGVNDVDADVAIDGHVARAIVDYARVNRCDLIAMATHGRGAARYLMGSVADKVLRASELPVLLNHPLTVRSRVPRAREAAATG
jgi:nucleotide-binding universal stress UspA family protein